MIKLIILFSLVSNLMVSGNLLAQIVPTLHTCPHTCNQNSYQNVNTYQNPNNFQIPNYQNQNNLNIPVLFQQNPTKQVPIIQQNTAPTITQQPINNNQLYPHQHMHQNQLTPPVPNNQIINPVANQLSQLYMNKILSNPTIQTFLDQNSNILFNNGPEYPQQRNNMATQVPNAGTPTVINNYFLLPPEMLNPDKDHNIQPPKRANDHKRDREAPKRRSHEHSDDRRRPSHDVDNSHPDIKRKHVPNPDCPVHSRKESHRTSEPFVEEADHRFSAEERDRNSRRRKQNGINHERQRDRYILPDHHTQYQRIHPERHNVDMTRHHEPPRHHDSPRSHQEMKRPNIIIKIKEKPKQSSSENGLPNSHEKSREVTYQSRVGKNARHSRDDEIVEDFKKKFPAIPEEVVRNLLAYLRRQIQKQQLGHPQFYYPDVSFPLRYDQLFPHSFVRDLYDRSDRRSRPNRKPKRKQHKTKNNSYIDTETTTNVDYLTSTIPTTTETSTIDSSNENKISSETNSMPKHKFETTTTNYSPEQDTEYTVKGNNGIIDDYFPDFSQDKTYYESGEVFNVRNLRDNRYHYTTDRNYGTKHNHDKTDNQKNTKVTTISEEISEVLSKPIDTKIETTSTKYEIETEIQYRTPPSLESPDFKTKQIMRNKPNTNDKNLSYKSSTYSNAKNPSKTDKKGQKLGNSKKMNTDSIETMYAHSKVAKYGKVTDENEENVTPVVTYYLPDNMQYEEDGKTIIVAKRIPADHFW